MTVSTTHSENLYTGNGSQTNYSFSFRVLSAAVPGVIVYLANVLQSSGFVVLPNTNQDTSPGGTVVFDVAPANGTAIILRRATTKTQDADFPLESKLNTQALETALDKAILCIQENARDLVYRSFVWRGNWSSSNAYLVGEAVFYNGSSYICITANINSAPPSANWQTLASKGDTGPGGAGSGTVSSVALTVPASILSVTGSPVTTTGTLAVSLANQNANLIFSGPTSGGAATPTFRALVDADIPATLTGKTLGATTKFSAAPVPTALGTIDLGSTTAAFKNLYLSPSGGTNYQRLTVAALTGDRVFTLPDADSNSVRPATAGASQFMTSISSTGVIGFAQPASSDLSDASNVALRNNSNSWSTAQLPNAAGTIDLGSTALPFRNLYVGGAATNNTKLVSTTLTAQRTVTFPDANSNTVIPSTAGSHQFATSISSGGVVGYSQPSSSDLSDSTNIALVNNANNFSTAQLPGTAGTIDLGSNAKPWRNLYLGGAATNNQKFVSATTAAMRTFTLPDADSNPVQPASSTSGKWVKNIDSSGVQNLTQPAFSDISGTASAAQGGTGVNGGTAANGTLLIGNGSGYTLATLTSGSGITITNSAGGITIAASGGGGGGLVWTLFSKSGSFTASNGNGSYYRNSSTGTITLPVSPADGTLLAFKQASGTGTFAPNGAEVINMPFGTSETAPTIETFSGTVVLQAVSGGWDVV